MPGDRVFIASDNLIAAQYVHLEGDGPGRTSVGYLLVGHIDHTRQCKPSDEITTELATNDVIIG